MRVERAGVESHVGIIDRSGGVTVVTVLLRKVGFPLADNTVACWVTRNNIPRPYWPAMVRLGLATNEELEDAYQRRRAQRAETRRLARGLAQ